MRNIPRNRPTITKVILRDIFFCVRTDISKTFRVTELYNLGKEKKMNNFKNQSGRSMIEMLGVLAIIGVLSVGGIAGYSKAMLKFKINKTIDQMAMIATNVRTLYAQQASYDIATAQAYNMGVIDDAIGSSMKNVFNGDVTVDASSSGATFDIVFTNLPREACVTVATNDWGSNYSSGLVGVGTGASAEAVATALGTCAPGGTGSAGETGACVTDGKSAALTVSKAASGCANGGAVGLRFY